VTTIKQPPAKPSYEELERRLEEALLEIKRLREMLDKLIKKPKLNSKNSSQPPSQDPPYQPKSERAKSNKPSGGQLGHQGKTLEWQPKIDEIVVHAPQGQCECGKAYSQGKLLSVEKRQVLDLPEPKLHVIEHQAQTWECSCGRIRRAEFPSQVSARVQYGSRLRGLGLYLMNTHYLSLERVGQYFAEVYQAPISQGSLVNWQAKGYEALSQVQSQIVNALKQSTVLHADETGIRVAGKNQWWHSVSTASLTHYNVSKHRGMVGIKAGGVLENYQGVVVHDCWGAYFGLPSQHALCHAHLQRELTRVVETSKQTWASQLKIHLGVMQRRVQAAKAGFLRLPQIERLELAAIFDGLVQIGLQQNPAVLRTDQTSTTRGAVKQSYQRCLALRLEKYGSSWLRFLFEPDVPSDNNQAERDVRMVKLREKVSGGSRGDGAVWFARIRGYISSLRKNKQNVFQALKNVFDGNPTLPASLVKINTS
jgi:transposase